jgi:phosphonoacetaldehyde hydrolase
MAHPTVAATWEAAKGSAPTLEDEVRIYAALEPLMQASAARRTELIPGAAGVAQWLKGQGIKVGSCTGYTPQMMQAILPRAAEQGYAPDVVVCAGDTPSGRPSPQMVWKALTTLDVWPASACVKVDDAPVGIEEGRNAGCWTIGLAASGNGVGLTLEQYQALSETDRTARVDASARLLKAAGADFVIDSVADIRPVLDEIASRIAVSQSS